MDDSLINPRRLAGLARGKMRIKYAALVEALTGRFDDHPAKNGRTLVDHIDALSTRIDQLTSRIEALIGAIPAGQGVNADRTTGPRRQRRLRRAAAEDAANPR